MKFVAVVRSGWEDHDPTPFEIELEAEGWDAAVLEARTITDVILIGVYLDEEQDALEAFVRGEEVAHVP